MTTKQKPDTTRVRSILIPFIKGADTAKIYNDKNKTTRRLKVSTWQHNIVSDVNKNIVEIELLLGAEFGERFVKTSFAKYGSEFCVHLTL